MRALLLLFFATAIAQAPLIREEAQVTVGGVRETWRLQWKDVPQPECDTSGGIWVACGCNGFAFGERGELDLIRLRDGHESDRLELSPIFVDNELDLGKMAVVQKWPVEKRDIEDRHSDKLPARVAARPIVKIIRLGDYDHDGQATEFFLQTGTLPCAKRTGVVVGVSKKNPRLHVFGTALHPDKPLVLQYEEWQAVLHASGSARMIDWACGDQGADTQTEVELRLTPDGIDVRWREYDCEDEGVQRTLLNERRQ